MVDLRPVVRGAGELLDVSCGTVLRLGCGTTAPVLRNAAHRRSSLAAGDRRVDHHLALFVYDVVALAAFCSGELQDHGRSLAPFCSFCSQQSGAWLRPPTMPLRPCEQALRLSARSALHEHYCSAVEGKADSGSVQAAFIIKRRGLHNHSLDKASLPCLQAAANPHDATVSIPRKCFII